MSIIATYYTYHEDSKYYMLPYNKAFNLRQKEVQIRFPWLAAIVQNVLTTYRRLIECQWLLS